LSGKSSSSAVSVDVAVDASAELGEGPAWDSREEVIWWVDITRHTVHRYEPHNRRDSTYDVRHDVGAVVPRASGGVALALQHGFAVMDPESGHLEIIAPVEENRSGNRMNDAKCDRSGRLWGGTMAYDESPGAGSFYRLDPDHSVTRILENITCSNGLGWSPDERTMYYIDSGEQRIDAFDFGPDGDLGNRREFVAIPSTVGTPDGMTVDADGCLWVALWGAGAIHRYSPDGSLDRLISVPAKQVTSCVFGGAHLTDLYITSARLGLNDFDLKEHPHSGALFVCRPGVVGQPTYSYRG
jgi:sugar lactone lactonase YvrE